MKSGSMLIQILFAAELNVLQICSKKHPFIIALIISGKMRTVMFMLALRFCMYATLL